MPRLDPLFEALLARKGSDLHIAADRPPMLRVRGELCTARATSSNAAEVDAWLLELLDADQKARLAQDHELDFAWAHRDKARFRASYFYKSTGLGGVFRPIPAKATTLEELGAPRVLTDIAQRTSGLVLVTGPAGSGKTTTLAAMIRHVTESRPCHVLTIESPIEFTYDGTAARVTQREIGKHAPDFATALRAAAREDADVIVIGELHDAETMALALRLASLGVLVFATLTASGAQATLDRFLCAFPADERSTIRAALAQNLRAIVAQELVPTSDGQGRVAVHEVLLGSGPLGGLIREDKTAQIPSLLSAGRAAGMQSFDSALATMVHQQKITADVALERARDRQAMVTALRSLKAGT